MPLWETFAGGLILRWAVLCIGLTFALIVLFIPGPGLAYIGIVGLGPAAVDKKPLVGVGTLSPTPFAHMSQQCQARMITADTCGFIGASDVYGNGVRIGIYLQLFASLLAKSLSNAISTQILATNFVFFVSLFFLIVKMTFEDRCTFAAEIMILYGLFFAAFYVFFMSPTWTSINKDTENDKSTPGIAWPLVLSSSLSGAVGLHAMWFWYRGVATSFEQSPCGVRVVLIWGFRQSRTDLARLLYFLMSWGASLFFT